MPILKIDRAFYEADDKTKTYRYYGRNPEWRKLSKEDNIKNKRRIDGYTRVFPNGKEEVFHFNE